MNRFSVEQFGALVEAAASVAAEAELNRVLKRAIDIAKETIGATYVALGVLGEHGSHSQFIHLGMSEEEVVAVGHPPVGKGVLGTLIKDPHPILTDNLREHPDFTGFPPGHPAMKNFLGVPIKVGESVFGNFYLADKPGGFDSADQGVMEALAAVVGSAVSGARLRERLTALAVVEDRERIARDLHDAVIQDLFAVGLGLQAISMSAADSELSEKLDDAITRIDESIAALRTVIFDLRSLGTALSDPERTLKRMVDRLVSDRGIRYLVSAADLDSPPPDRLDDAFQVVRESVSNAARHSGAKTVSVTMIRKGHELVCTVEDDGQGFDPSRVARGMGLDNLESRIARISGRLEIDSRIGEGTTVTATIPLR